MGIKRRRGRDLRAAESSREAVPERWLVPANEDRPRVELYALRRRPARALRPHGTGRSSRELDLHRGGSREQLLVGVRRQRLVDRPVRRLGFLPPPLALAAACREVAANRRFALFERTLRERPPEQLIERPAVGLSRAGHPSAR